mmetsp:Transcript_20379/g.31831  ORF Transcript_20379/g.31831 Transcript_20379/m.31831 type:complete len:183 (+) Transcript_20379:124-672(+)
MFSSQSSVSRELLKKPDELYDNSPSLTLQQVGLGQSRGYLLVRELPDSTGTKKWCVLKEDKLWLFETPDTTKPGYSLQLENAVVSDGVRSRMRQADQSNSFDVLTAKGRHFVMQAKSPGDANMWIRAMRQHTAKETENQVMDRAERAIRKAEVATAASIAELARKVRNTSNGRGARTPSPAS